MNKANTLMIFVTISTVAGFLLAGQTLWGHGDEKHPDNNQQTSHMQAMYALKDKIPQEYRIMERTPIVPNQESITSGKALYQQQCAQCHGDDGRGNGPAANGLEPPPANFLDLEHSSIYGPGEKYWIIGNGSGETGMPAFQDIDPVDRWHLVNYIFNLQTSADKKDGDNHNH
ncbi:MAG: c-type cytochrome [Pelovirga sp.]